MTAEKVYFEHDGVKVTNTRLVVDNRTFAMASITSIICVENKPSRVLPILLLLIVAAMSATATQFTVWHAIGLVLPVVWLVKQASMFSIVIGSASGESQAMQSKQKAFANSVVSAVNTAIIERG